MTGAGDAPDAESSRGASREPAAVPAPSRIRPMVVLWVTLGVVLTFAAAVAAWMYWISGMLLGVST
jgi:hypothetical protein